MSLSLDAFTDKAQASVAAALQLAKDYSHAQREFFLLPTPLNMDSLTLSLVYPAHLAFVLLNEGAGDTTAPGGVSHAQTPLFASVIQKAGGDVVSLIIPLVFSFASLTSCFSDSRQARSPKTHCPPTLTISRTRRSLPLL